MIQRIALYTTLGLVLNAVEVQFNTWAFWSIVALFWASEHMTRRELIEQLQAEVAAARAAAGLDNNKDTPRND
jgi:hypothetical protein